MNIKKSILISTVLINLVGLDYELCYAKQPTEEKKVPLNLRRNVWTQSSHPRTTLTLPVLKTVVIPDYQLELAVKEALNLPESTILTNVHLSQLYTLESPNNQITSLEGLEHATNLITVDLQGNQIQSLEPFRQLTNIEWLKLSDNSIQDISPLTNSIKLKKLTLNNNPLQSIEGLSRFVELKYLSLRNVGLTSIEELAPLNQLIHLELDQNQIQDLSPLSDCLSLEELLVAFNQVESVAPLKKLTNIKKIRLNSNQIMDFSPVAHYQEGVDLEAYNQEVTLSIDNIIGYEFKNPLYALSSTPFTWHYPTGEWEHLSQINDYTLKVIKPFPNFPHTMEFGEWDQKVSWLITLESNAFDDSYDVIFEDETLERLVIEQLGLNNEKVTQFNIDRLYELNIENSGVKSLKGLEFATNLVTLNANGNQLSDLSPLTQLSRLEWLKLNANQIDSIKPLLNLKRLKQLDLGNNPIETIEGISTFSELSYLTLDQTRIIDWSPLVGLNNLQMLSANQNQITDVTPLSELKSLTHLYLYRNQIERVAPLTKLKQLSTLDVSHNQIKDFSELKTLATSVTLLLNDQNISIFISENKVGKTFANPVKSLDGAFVPWQLSTQQETVLSLSPDASTVTLHQPIPDDLGPIYFSEGSFNGWIEFAIQKTDSDLEIKGNIETTLLSINVPDDPSIFVLNPNLEPDQMFVSPEFVIENQSNAPIEVSVLAFEQVTNLMNDVSPETHSSWGELIGSSRYDFALGLTPLTSDGWEQTPSTHYVAETYPQSLGIMKGKQTVRFGFDAKHGKSFKDSLRPQYRLVLSFELKS